MSNTLVCLGHRRTTVLVYQQERARLRVPYLVPISNLCNNFLLLGALEGVQAPFRIERPLEMRAEVHICHTTCK